MTELERLRKLAEASLWAAVDPTPKTPEEQQRLWAENAAAQHAYMVESERLRRIEFEEANRRFLETGEGPDPYDAPAHGFP